jgi:hypothetical protein
MIIENARLVVCVVLVYSHYVVRDKETIHGVRVPVGETSSQNTDTSVPISFNDKRK